MNPLARSASRARGGASRSETQWAPPAPSPPRWETGAPRSGNHVCRLTLTPRLSVTGSRHQPVPAHTRRPVSSRDGSSQNEV